ncbi:MAG: DUF559 domain-containing protein [Verrucomicrobiota bacterium]
MRQGTQNLARKSHLNPRTQTLWLTRSPKQKDALLQQHGYLVLRFLAEDAGKHLDQVLDAILATLAHRESARTNQNGQRFHLSKG